jgi:Protein of unknown function (DUF2975)
MTHSRPSGSTIFATNLATLLLVLGCAFGIYLIGKAMLGGRQEVAAHQNVRLRALESLPPEVIRPATVPLTIRIRNADGHQLLLSTGRDLIVIVWMAVLLWLVRRLLLSVGKGDPFTAANVRRLRSMGFLLLVGLPLANGLSQVLDARLAETSPAGRLGTIFNLELGPGPLVALGVFVLAEVFAHGARLREDVEGTV